MDLIEEIKNYLDTINAIKGVENTILTQRDGKPITSSGVWLSKNEIFNVSAATSAIYNVGLSLHGQWLKYLIIEGPKAKIMIAPLQNDQNQDQSQHAHFYKNNEFFIALTTQSQVNLGSMFIKTQSTLQKINSTIMATKQDFKPPLREFNDKQVEFILEKFNSKEETFNDMQIFDASYSINYSLYKKCEDILWNFYKMIPNLIYSSISLRGGFIVNSIQPSPSFNLTPDDETAMSYSLYDTAARYAWLLKKMKISSIYMDCGHYIQFIMGFNGGLFSNYLFSKNQHLGFIRLIIPKYLTLIQKLIGEASVIEFLDNQENEMISPLAIR
ncbi:MAG: roadblock/LC7 domain-containing protein [Promethearchaeota archaeon]